MQTVRDEYNDQGKELREHGSVAFPAACYGGDWRNTSVPLHWHGELEAGFVTSGEITLIVGKDRIPLRQGQGFFINSGIPHAFAKGSEETSSQCSIVFDPSIAGGRMDSIFWQKYVQPVIGEIAMPWTGLKREIPWQSCILDGVMRAWEVCSKKEAGYELDARDALTQILVQLEKNRPLEQPASAGRILRDNERIRLMMSYIQSHYREELTVSQIAASAMISVSEALRCFHNTTGMTPIQCVKHYRIQRAAGALLDPDKKISQVAAECGFQEMSYFARAFREIMGMTPSRYRSQLRRNENEA
jgi:AraC-like DNA-binding protein